MSVSSNAASEASKKGLSGKAKRQYVGGAINRARHEKAHEKADHREAMADARSQIRYHEAQIAGLREGIKQRRELAGAAKPKPKRAPRPKKPPDYEQTRQRQIAAAGGLVPKTPLDRLRKMPVREMSDPQLLRDWENHPPERRRGVLEREMARRQAKAEKAQQPKPAKAKRGADVGKLRERERELMARDAALEREQSDLLERANDEPDVSRGHAAATRAIYHIGPEREKVNRQLKAIRTRLRNAGG